LINIYDTMNEELEPTMEPMPVMEEPMAELAKNTDI